jgi:hypothetical protein
MCRTNRNRTPCWGVFLGLAGSIWLGGVGKTPAADLEIPPEPGPPQLILLNGGISLGEMDPQPGHEVISEALIGQVICPTGVCWLGILLPPGQDQVCLVWEGAKGGSPETIPVTWELRFGARGQWSPWLSPLPEGGPNAPGKGLWWVIGESLAETWKYDFQLRCRAKISRLFLAGDYRMFFNLTVEEGPSRPGGKTKSWEGRSSFGGFFDKPKQRKRRWIPPFGRDRNGGGSGPPSPGGLFDKSKQRKPQRR